MFAVGFMLVLCTSIGVTNSALVQLNQNIEMEISRGPIFFSRFVVLRQRVGRICFVMRGYSVQDVPTALLYWSTEYKLVRQISMLTEF